MFYELKIIKGYELLPFTDTETAITDTVVVNFDMIMECVPEDNVFNKPAYILLEPIPALSNEVERYEIPNYVYHEIHELKQALNLINSKLSKDGE